MKEKMQLRSISKSFNVDAPLVSVQGAPTITGYEQDMLYVMLSYLVPKSDPLWNIQPSRQPRVHNDEPATGIDILIPCYMHAKHIKTVVASVLKQQYTNLAVHVLLMDEASQKLQSELEGMDPRVCCYQHDRLKPAAARNWLATKGSYSHILFLDADDPLEYPDILDQFLRFSNYDIVMPIWEDREGVLITDTTFYNVLYCSQTTALMNRSSFSSILFDERLVNGAEDTEFFLRAYLQGARIVYSDTAFRRSLVRKASEWSFLKYGAYDLLYKHRECFLPLLRQAYSAELDAETLSRIYYTIRLLESNIPTSYANMQELAESGTVAAVWLLRSLPANHIHRQHNIFKQLVDAISDLKDSNRRVNLMLTRQHRQTAAAPAALEDISIIIPCYKQSRFVKAAIESILKQTRESLVREILVLAMDKESSMLKPELERMDPRVTCFCEKRMWLPEARNYLVSKSTGSHILPLDADDQLDPSALAVMEPYASCYDVVTADTINPEGFVSSLKYTRTDNLFELPVASPTSLISRSFIDQALGGIAYDPLFNTGFEDHDFWFRAIMHGAVKYIRQPLIRYRIAALERTDGDTSYLNLAIANFNLLELYIKNATLFSKYIDMSVRRRVPGARHVKALMASIHISLGDLDEH